MTRISNEQYNERREGSKRTALLLILFLQALIRGLGILQSFLRLCNFALQGLDLVYIFDFLRSQFLLFPLGQAELTLRLLEQYLHPLEFSLMLGNSILQNAILLGNLPMELLVCPLKCFFAFLSFKGNQRRIICKNEAKCRIAFFVIIVFVFIRVHSP